MATEAAALAVFSSPISLCPELCSRRPQVAAERDAAFAFAHRHCELPVAARVFVTRLGPCCVPLLQLTDTDPLPALSSSTQPSRDEEGARSLITLAPLQLAALEPHAPLLPPLLPDRPISSSGLVQRIRFRRQATNPHPPASPAALFPHNRGPVLPCKSHRSPLHPPILSWPLSRQNATGSTSACSRALTSTTQKPLPT
jgi:hypothetical protein